MKGKGNKHVWLVTPDRINTEIFRTKRQALEYLKKSGLVYNEKAGYYVVDKNEITEFDCSLSKVMLK